MFGSIAGIGNTTSLEIAKAEKEDADLRARAEKLHREALSHLQRKEYKEALKVCNNILESHFPYPYDIDANNTKANIYFELGDFDKAVIFFYKASGDHLDKDIVSLPRPIYFRPTIGRLCAQAERALKYKDYRRAEFHYQAALEYLDPKKPFNPYKQKYKGYIDWINKRIEKINKAKKEVKQESYITIKYKTIDYDELIESAAEYRKKGWYRAAIDDYSQLLKYVEFQITQFRPSLLSIAIFGYSNDPELEKRKAIALEGIGDSLMALEKFEEAKKIYTVLIHVNITVCTETEWGLPCSHGSSKIYEKLARCSKKLANKNNDNTLARDVLNYYKIALKREEDDLWSASYYLSSRYYTNKRIAELNYQVAKTHFELGENKQSLEIVNNIIESGSKSERSYFKTHLVRANALLALGNFREANESFAIAKMQKYPKTTFTHQFLHPTVGYFYVKAKSSLQEKSYTLARENLEKAIDAAKINCRGIVPAFLEEEYQKVNIVCETLFRKSSTGEKSAAPVLALTRLSEGSAKFHYDVYELLVHATERNTDLIYFLKSLSENLLMAYWLGDKRVPNELKGSINQFIPWLQREQALNEEVSARLQEIKREDKEYVIAQKALFEMHFYTRRAYATQLNRPYANFKERFEDIRKAFQYLISACQSLDNLKMNLFANFFGLYECVDGAGTIDNEKLESKCWVALVNEFRGREKIPLQEQFVYSGTHAQQFHRQLLYRVISQEEMEVLKDDLPSLSDSFISEAQQQFKTLVQSISTQKTDVDEVKSYCIPITKEHLTRDGITLILNKTGCEIARVAVISNNLILIGYGHALTINLTEANLPIKNLIISNSSIRNQITNITGQDLSQLNFFHAHVGGLLFDINANAQQFIVEGQSVRFTKSDLTFSSLKLNVNTVIVEQNSAIQSIYTQINKQSSINIQGKFHSKFSEIYADSIELTEGSELHLEDALVKCDDAFILKPRTLFQYHHLNLEVKESIEVAPEAQWIPDSEEHEQTASAIVKTNGYFTMEGEFRAGELALEADEDHWDGNVKIHRKENFTLPQNVVNRTPFAFTVKSNKGFVKGHFEAPVARFRRNHLALYGASSFPTFAEFLKLLVQRETCLSSFPIDANGSTRDPLTSESQRFRLEFFSPLGIWLGTKARSTNVVRCEIVDLSLNSNISREKSVILLPIELLSTQGIENAYEDVCNLYRLIRERNFSAMQQEISAKLQLDNVIYWLVWLIRKFIPGLSSAANLSYALFNLVKQSATLARQCSDLFRQRQQGIPVEYVQLIELLYAAAPFAQLGIIAATEIPEICQEGIGSIQPVIPNMTVKDAAILTLQLFAPRESMLSLTNALQFGFKQNPLTNINQITILDSDFGKIIPGISLSSSSLIGFHAGGMKLSPTVFEQAVISYSGPRLVFADSITEQALHLIVSDDPFWHRYYANTVTIDTPDFGKFYKDFLARKGLFENIIAERRLVKMDNDVDFDKKYHSDYKIGITTTSNKPIVLKVKIDVPSFSLTSNGDIINKKHIDGEDGVTLFSIHGKVINDCQLRYAVGHHGKLYPYWDPASISSAQGQVALIGNEVIDKGNIQAQGKIIFQGDELVSVIALARTTTTHKKHKEWLGLITEMVDEPQVEVHNPTLSTDDVVIVNCPHGPIVITGVTFKSNTEFYGQTIDEKPIIVDTTTHRHNRILGGILGGSNSTSQHQVAIPTVHYAQRAIYIATIGNVVLDGACINVDLFKVKTPKKLIMKTPVLQHSSDTISWGFTPSAGVPLISEIKNLGREAKTLTHSGSPALVPLNTATLAANAGNAVHDITQAATSLSQHHPLTALNPQASLTFRLSRTHEDHQTTAESYLLARDMQVEASEMELGVSLIQVANANWNCPVITISGTSLNSSYRRGELDLSATVSATGALGGGATVRVDRGHATHYQHAEVRVGTLSLEGTRTFGLVDADLDADRVVGDIPQMRISSHQDRTSDEAGSVGISSSLSLTLSDFADQSAVTRPSHFNTLDGSGLRVVRLDLRGSEFDAPGAEVKSRTVTHNQDSQQAFSGSLSVNLAELKSQQNPKPFPIPATVSFSEQKRSGIDGELKEVKHLRAECSIPLVSVNSFATLARDSQALIQAIQLPVTHIGVQKESEEKQPSPKHPVHSSLSSEHKKAQEESKIVSTALATLSPSRIETVEETIRDELANRNQFGVETTHNASSLEEMDVLPPLLDPEEIAADILTTLPSSADNHFTRDLVDRLTQLHTSQEIALDILRSQNLRQGSDDYALNDMWRTIASTAPDDSLLHLIYTTPENYELARRALNGFWKQINDTITDSIINDSCTLFVKSMAPTAPNGSLLSLMSDRISTEDYELAQARMVARKDAFDHLFSWLADASVVAGTLGDPTPLPTSIVATYQDSIDRYDQSIANLASTIANVYDHMSQMSRPELVEAISYGLTSFVLLGIGYMGYKALLNYSKFEMPFLPRFHNMETADLLPQGAELVTVDDIRSTIGKKEYIFTVTTKGEMKFAPMELKAPISYGNRTFYENHHPNLCDGQSVVLAGRLTTRDGYLIRADNFSGHYLPHGDHLDQLAERLFSQMSFTEIGGKFEKWQEIAISSSFKTYHNKMPFYDSAMPIYVAGTINAVLNSSQLHESNTEYKDGSPSPSYSFLYSILGSLNPISMAYAETKSKPKDDILTDSEHSISFAVTEVSKTMSERIAQGLKTTMLETINGEVIADLKLESAEKKLSGSYDKILSVLKAKPERSVFTATHLPPITRTLLPIIPYALFFADCAEGYEEVQKAAARVEDPRRETLRQTGRIISANVCAAAEIASATLPVCLATGPGATVCVPASIALTGLGAFACGRFGMKVGDKIYEMGSKGRFHR